MPYGINGSGFALQPSIGRWTQRDNLGTDGGGHPIYPAVRQFEMQWELSSQAELKELIDYFSLVSNTGTAVVSLPQYGAPSYIFKNYSGCTLSEPEFGEYFEEYSKSVSLLVFNVRT